MTFERPVSQLSDLTGRVALVTGGAGHLGSVLCDALAELGAAVAVVDLPGQSLESVAARIANHWPVEVIPLPADLADEAQVRQLPARVHQHFNRMDILVHCAALVGTSDLKGWATPLAEQSTDTWRRALEINLTVPFILTQACAPALAAEGRGSIISIGSIYGMVGPDLRLYDGTGMGNPAAYAASKGGLVQITRWFAAVLAPRVRVNAISLGGIERQQPESFVSRYSERVPLGRMASEEDIKGALIYLASDLSAYVTGQNLVVDGGWTVW